jgi:hypothetical protein
MRRTQLGQIVLGMNAGMENCSSTPGLQAGIGNPFKRRFTLSRNHVQIRASQTNPT